MIIRTRNFIFLNLLLSVSSSAFAETADSILAKADDIRNPSLSSKILVQVETKGEDTVELEVSIKGKDKTYVHMLKPAGDRGKKMLMLGEEMWVSTPKLSKPVRVSLNQKLSGQAANGDITRQRWSGDYEAKIEEQDAKHWVLGLTANKKGLTYDRIRLWVGKKNYRPIRAEYLTKSGKILKRAKFGKYKEMSGAMRPSETIISSATKESDKSIITTLKVTDMTFPDSLFNQNSLK